MASAPVTDGVVTCLLTAMSLMALAGLRYPARMLPILPTFVWEFSLGVYLVVTGFSPAESHHVVMSGHPASP